MQATCKEKRQSKSNFWKDYAYKNICCDTSFLLLQSPVSINLPQA